MMRAKSPQYVGLSTIIFLLLSVFWATRTQLSFAQTRKEVESRAAEEIVAQFFPPQLLKESREEFEAGGLEPFQASSFVLADLSGTGTADFIVAAYTNGFSAVVRVLQNQGGNVVLADEPDVPGLGGVFPEVRLLDLDGDGKPEVIISLTSARGPAADWIFNWAGTKLNLISPPPFDQKTLSTALVESAFLDLNRDGKLEIISTHQRDDDIFVYDIFRLAEGRYVFGGSMDYFGTFIQPTDTPQETVRTFAVSNPMGEFRLRVINGDDQGNNRVNDAVISLNSIVVVGPDRFKRQPAEITSSVTLQRTNMLGVKLRSAPGSQLTITIDEQLIE